MNLAQHLDWDQASRNVGTTFAQFIANTISHEIGHTFGLNEAYVNQNATNNGTILPTLSQSKIDDLILALTGHPINLTFTEDALVDQPSQFAYPYDMMIVGSPFLNDRFFAESNISLLQAALGVHNENELLNDANLTVYRLPNGNTYLPNTTTLNKFISPLESYRRTYNLPNNSTAI
ncbi:hypothetical protein [Spirulina sp. 06S082]|uniref:hypothetical protein n=1 Tax=Spirulina sp. 06S082 TaxID=3110248 RepID=UPI002B217615|nr:hypothetical protein [Spirulina sp. 06S082]MEA5469099.1 hypothetical protein [Spirulina sp. 06S082]